MARKRWNSSSFSVASIGAAALALATVGSFTVPRGSQPRRALPLESISLAVVDAAYQRGQEVVPLPAAASFVVPHHLTAAVLIGRAVGTARLAQPQTIVVLGPDHPNRGARRFTTSRSAWTWHGERYWPANGVVSALAAEPDVGTDDALVAEEHSVLTPVPFLHRQFPHARFVLLTVRSDFDAAAAQRMAAFLNRTLAAHDLVVASVDFSHYKTLEAARADDTQALAALAKASPEAMRGIPADSPMSLAIAMAFAHLRGARGQTIVDHTNSAELTGNLASTSTTSYIDVVFHGQ